MKSDARIRRNPSSKQGVKDDDISREKACRMMRLEQGLGPGKKAGEGVILPLFSREARGSLF
jgi:hypothetical protein